MQNKTYAGSSRVAIVQVPMAISGTFGYLTNMPMVAFDWQSVTSC